MMGGYGMGGMGMGGGAFGFFGLITWIVWLTVGVLLVVYLWKKISKE